MHSQAVEISLCLFSALGYALPQWPTSENPAIEVENILQARAFIDACQVRRQYDMDDHEKVDVWVADILQSL